MPVAALSLKEEQALPWVQFRGDPGAPLPAWHVSAPLPSAACWQPKTGSQVSALQGLLSLQSRAAPDVQAPAWHVSAPLHTLPSLHEMPFASAVCWHPFTESQVSVVHGLLSLQLRAAPAVHTPAWHVSAPLHAFPSLQEVPLRSAV